MRNWNNVLKSIRRRVENLRVNEKLNKGVKINYEMLLKFSNNASLVKNNQMEEKIRLMIKTEPNNAVFWIENMFNNFSCMASLFLLFII